MKKALISPNETPIYYISDWTKDIPPQAIKTPIDNSCKIVQVQDQDFEVALPLFWVNCNNDINPTLYYFNLTDNEIYPLPESPPMPTI
jgi:hypothetical protein